MLTCKSVCRPVIHRNTALGKETAPKQICLGDKSAATCSLWTPISQVCMFLITQPCSKDPIRSTLDAVCSAFMLPWQEHSGHLFGTEAEGMDLLPKGQWSGQAARFQICCGAWYATGLFPRHQISPKVLQVGFEYESWTNHSRGKVISFGDVIHWKWFITPSTTKG